MQNTVNRRLGQSEAVSLAPLHRNPSAEDMDQAIRDATFAVETLDWLRPGDTVFIKPVLNSGKPYPATTNNDDR